MATERLRHIIEAVWTGGQATSKAATEIGGVGKAAKKSKSQVKDWVTGMAAGALTIAGVQRAAKDLYKAIGEGADLELASARFDNLAGSIGAVSSALLNDLRKATHGMVSDADLISSASDIISLGLADNQEDVTRLATLISELGWDMQQVILTFANDSTMRLDSLGLSVEDVTTKAKAFEEQGIAASKAFDLAVIEAGEERLRLLGSAAGSTAGKIKQVETSITNFKDAAKQALAGEVADEFALIGDAAVQSQGGVKEFGSILGESLGKAITTIPQVKSGLGQLKAVTYLLGLTTEETTKKVDEHEAAMMRNDRIMASHSDTMTQVNRDWSEFNRLVEAGAQEQRDEAMAAAEQEEARRSLTNAIDWETEAVEDNSEAIAAWKDEIARAEERAQLLREEVVKSRQEFGGNFLSAVRDSKDEAINWKDALFEAAAQAGASRESLVLLAAATGEYTDAQIEAALKTAAMRDKVEELAGKIADGELTTRDAIATLEIFEEQLSADYVINVDGESVDYAKSAAEALEERMQRLDGLTSTVTVVTNNVRTGWGPSDVEHGPPDINHATGTDGAWLTVPPGYANDSFTVGLTSGEKYAVMPASGGGEAPAGTSYNIAHMTVMQTPGATLDQLVGATYRMNRG